MTAREIALKALYDIEINGTYTNAALNSALSSTELELCDRGFVTELIYGVVSNKTAIDFIISKYSKIKIKKMSPWVLSILRMGIFQIYYMERIPYSAACNEAVKLAKKYSHRAGTGFVNGVLRSFAREVDSFQFPDGKSHAEYLSLKYSYPLWMTEKLISEYGAERCEELYEENSKAHGVFLRVNTHKVSTDELIERLKNEGVNCEKTHIDGCLKMMGRLSIDKSNAYREGLYSLQNISSQMAVAALAPKSGDTVIDMCAAPGGKSCAIAEKMENYGKILSFDVFEHKVDLINKSAQRLGIDIIDARLQDGTVCLTELENSADCVLADVPCSGFGVIHKKPDIKWRRTEADIEELCKIQKQILKNAAAYVKSGGTLVYSTCTILPEENRLQIDEFLKNNSEFKKLSEEQILTGEMGESGFYICKMMKG